jgi:hypothetical protein
VLYAWPGLWYVILGLSLWAMVTSERLEWAQSGVETQPTSLQGSPVQTQFYTLNTFNCCDLESDYHLLSQYSEFRISIELILLEILLIIFKTMGSFLWQRMLMTKS